jgi:hypothetical protein
LFIKPVKRSNGKEWSYLDRRFDIYRMCTQTPIIMIVSVKPFQNEYGRR